MTGRYLNMKEPGPKADGLIPELDADGVPLATAPAVLEARRFYDALGVPPGSERPPEPAPATAPLTLAEWMKTFQFPARQPGESLQAWRDRTGVAVYYNRNELGLGRELGCSRFVDGWVDGEPQYGQACFVSNYATAWADEHNALAAALGGVNRKNTVCITYRPLLRPGGADGYQVQFYVYGSDDRRQDWAQLDRMGPRATPQVCMGCHGGEYDAERHLARNARFLPAYPELLVFAQGEGVPAGVTRAGQEERLRVLNEVAALTSLSPLQRNALEGAYQGRLHTPGQAASADWTPEGWRATPRQQDLYRQVVKPYCASCHAADAVRTDGSERPAYAALRSHDAFVRSAALAYTCGSFQMPNAQPGLREFWAPKEGGVVVRNDAGVPERFVAPADALLAAFGLDRSACTRLAESSDCRQMGGDAVCGNAHSGSACDAQSGRCLPDAPPPAGASSGWCRTGPALGRGCSSGQECLPAAGGPPGFDGACHDCGRTGQPACTIAPGCAEGLRRGTGPNAARCVQCESGGDCAGGVCDPATFACGP